jgi:AraC-like DNA-binding protein
MTDALTRILNHLDLRAGIFAHARYCGRWAMNTSGSRMATFHLVQAGGAWLHLPGAAPRRLGSGDLVLFPRDQTHLLASGPDSFAEEEVNRAQPVNESPDVVMLCGYFEFAGRTAWCVLDALPDAVVISCGSAAGGCQLSALVALITDELASSPLGSEAVVNFYAQALFIHILRTAVAEGLDGGLLSALSDPQLGPALDLIHGSPEQPWTLARLAASAAMSRTAFAQRFRGLTGDTPLRYLAHWRMQLAAELLTASNSPMVEIAERCGYTSEVAFRKSFRRLMGVAPGAYRKRRGSAARLHGPEQAG